MHVLVQEVVVALWACKFETVKCLECEAGDARGWDVHLPTVRTVRGFLLPAVDAGLAVEFFTFVTH